ncbi:stearoyl-CoA desaturase (delta-9 desaturase) [Luteibacter sp. Sphag1AF]|uniref:hypothetical protein n=1 Tax=Luteibacter sp. Sphag1AF TaxID=2587031 RepID=UPI0016137EE9|nr:hypothetical protein [Luteibacter sp. Sphag1AF]MBB3228869.1 stearoyl-CoA desaturase (delta-9 desaturase) [Luteibacter sp. Sphag1AF]
MNDQSLRLLPRAYSLRDAEGKRKRVTVREALRQYGQSLNFLADRRRTLHAAFEFSHFLMVIPTIIFFAYYVSVSTMVLYFVIFSVLANVANTIWYHRYCSHRAFQFSHPIIPKLCLWFNPLGYREEVYALVHHVHHTKADEDEDPNGPQLSWLGNYAASYFEIDTDITPAQYEHVKARLAHVGMPFSSYESFQRWACVESIPHYLGRWAFATVFWAGVFYAMGGMPTLMAWFAVQFCWHAIVRDFNFRGHGTPEKPKQVDGWDMDRRTLALNQRFYGYLAGEWHNNHHAFRASANTAFMRGQVDIPFQMIRLLKGVGIVSKYHDHRKEFAARFLNGEKVGRARAVDVVAEESTAPGHIG